jgi:hypothetical protein
VGVVSKVEVLKDGVHEVMVFCGQVSRDNVRIVGKVVILDLRRLGWGETGTGGVVRHEPV